jgi:hypothetical protein
MIRQYTTVEKERGETQQHIDICQTCPFPVSKCNGECNYYKAKAKELRQTKRLKKNIIVF